MIKEKVKAIVLLSGGVDSALVTLMLKGLGIEVIGLFFDTGFFVNKKDRLLKGKEEKHLKILRNFCEKEGIKLIIEDISEEFLKVALKPKYGYGANMNPCIDCRIFMLGKAKEIMLKEKAHFVATGEVLGQRPMSQRLETLKLIEKESGLKGKLLRPLSAKLLEETDVEKEKIVDREKLFDIKGRSKKRQIELLKEYQVPEIEFLQTGCCFLTDKVFSKRFKDKIDHSNGLLNLEDVELLMVGRHFRISNRLKLVVGRNEEENIFLEKRSKGRYLFKPLNVKGPIGISDESIPNGEEIKLCSSIVGRFCDKNGIKPLIGFSLDDSKIGEIEALCISDEELERLRI